ncbi:MAG: 2-C-methyl-D-erythritol 4-phosphate cytidylyltransferase [Chloroflexi bacterium]|nr:2-C-methyl-D-erythritol 4-phosphate cytidylyltransferase [Chloroflexota bacterium]
MIGGDLVGAILVAAGRSTRMGFDKLWADLGGRPVLSWSLSTLAACPALDRLVVVSSDERQDETWRLVGRSVPARLRPRTVLGGERRRDSVAAGLDALAECAWVLIHDAARPFITERLVVRGLAEVQETGACVAALPARDTIKRVDAARNVLETPPRAQLWTVQTPQLFRMDLLRRAMAAVDEDATDEAALIEQVGGTVRVFEGEVKGFKITTPEDLEIARALLAASGVSSEDVGPR